MTLAYKHDHVTHSNVPLNFVDTSHTFQIKERKWGHLAEPPSTMSWVGAVVVVNLEELIPGSGCVYCC